MSRQSSIELKIHVVDSTVSIWPNGAGCQGGTEWPTLWPAGAVELRNEIGRAVGAELPGTLVFDYPTVAAITGFLMSKLGKPAALASTAVPPVSARY